MNIKRYRSENWDDEEKNLFGRILKDYVCILRDQSLTTEANRKKILAWEEILEKFNSINRRERDLRQLKIQWKTIKKRARNAQKSSKSKQESIQANTSDGISPSPENSNDQVAGTSTVDEVFIEEDSQEHQALKRRLFCKNMPDSFTKTRKVEEDEYLASILNHTKYLKEKEYNRRMEMAEEEHKINLKILEEKLKCAEIEREILELKKARAESFSE